MKPKRTRKQIESTRKPPYKKQLDVAIDDYDMHFEDLRALGAHDTDLIRCMGRYLNTFWAE